MRIRTLGTVGLAAAGVLWAGAAQAACDPDYTGVEITVGTMNPPFIGGPAVAHAKTWEEKTCGKVNVVHFPFGELYTKFITPMVTNEPAYDVILHAPAWHGDFAPYLSEMPAKFQQGREWEDIHPTYRDRLMKWEGKQISVTIDGDVHTGTYRKDLFADPKNAADFKAKHGYDLAPPRTWTDYYNICEFFTGRQEGLYGTAEAFVRGGQQFWFFFSHAASYTNHPDHPGAMFFDPETMDAQVNNPGWVRALEDYIRSVSCAPPGALNWNSGDIRTAFAGGQVAMNFDWGDTGTIGADPAQSKVAGNVGFFLVPGSKEIWNHKTKQWDTFPDVVHSPFMAYGGWVASVPATTQNLEAAWDYVTWYTSIENSGNDVVTGGTGINPYRFTHFQNIDKWTKTFTVPEAENYLAVQKGAIDHPNVALDFRLPGYFQYTEVLEIELSKALNKEVTPQEALDAIAAEWNKLTDEFGRDKQLAIYRASMGL